MATKFDFLGEQRCARAAIFVAFVREGLAASGGKLSGGGK
jgi:hypothetical protein